MRVKSRAMAIAGISAVALLATACGGDNGGGGGAGDAPKPSIGAEEQAKEGGEITIDGCNPENPLIAANTAETCGGDPLDVITARLVHYNADTAEPENDIAESIETEDNQNFTVKIKQGYKYHDGSEVKAKDFVDAWNYAAYGPNGYAGSYFFEPIEGFAEVSDAKSKTKELSGLKVVDDYTFTIKTTEKVSNLPLRLGYTAFAPQPPSFFDDPEAFGKKPIGAGPFALESYTQGQSIVLKKFADYSGENKANVDKVTFKVFTNPDAAYTELQGGGIDVIRAVPAQALIDDKFETDLDGRAVRRETSTFQYVGLNPKTDPKLENPDLRRALSMAIDRKTIVDKIFNGAYTPATGWVSPVVEGYKGGACGEYCEFDEAKAKEMFDKAGGYDGKLTLTYNADGGHKEWTEAACNSIKNTLGVDCVATPAVDFKTMLTALDKREMKGLFRMGWQMDYPSIENYLAPIYSKGASSNYMDYDNPDFQKKLAEAAAAPEADEANKLYQEAEGILAEDFPTIPLWYGRATVGFGPKVANVKVTPFGTVDLTYISTK